MFLASAAVGNVVAAIARVSDHEDVFLTRHAIFNEISTGIFIIT